MIWGLLSLRFNSSTQSLLLFQLAIISILSTHICIWLLLSNASLLPNKGLTIIKCKLVQYPSHLKNWKGTGCVGFKGNVQGKRKYLTSIWAGSELASYWLISRLFRCVYLYIWWNMNVKPDKSVEGCNIHLRWRWRVYYQCSPLPRQPAKPWPRVLDLPTSCHLVYHDVMHYEAGGLAIVLWLQLELSNTALQSYNTIHSKTNCNINTTFQCTALKT